MKNRKTRSAMRRMLFTLALVLVVAVASVGGTIAWLTDKTDAVTNTFTVGDINIDLYETYKSDGSIGTGANNRIGINEWSAKLIPGTVYPKNPLVSVAAGSEDCYLFVKFEEINNPSTYLYYTSTLTVVNGWTKLTGEGITDNIWYRVVPANATANERSWYLLEGETLNEDETNAAYVHGKVTVKDDVTKDTMPTAKNAPKLQYTAYAIQTANTGSPLEAWNKITK